jgi:hypothetical protein
LGCGGAPLGLGGVVVLSLAGDLVSARNQLGGVEHAGVQAGNIGAQPWVLGAVGVDVLVLHSGHGLCAAGDDNIGVAGFDHPGSEGDGHEPGGALAVHRHPGHCDWQPGAQGSLTGQVHSLAALLQGCAEDDVVDFPGGKPGTADRVLNGVAGQGLGRGVVEGPLVRPADRGAGIGH